MMRILLPLLFVTVTSLKAQLSVIGSTNSNCSGSCNGAVIFSITGNSFPYTLTINSPSCNAPTVSSINTNTFLLSNICPCANNYQAVLIDNLANFAGTTSFSITSPPQIVTATAAVSPSCVGCCNGSLSFTTTGGVSPYTYTLNPGAMTGTSSTFTGLCAGNYTLTVGDASLCTRNFSITVPASPSGLKSLSKIEEWIVRYNADEEGFYISTGSQSKYSVKLFDLSGRLVWTENELSGNSFLRSATGKGIYFLEITSENAIVVRTKQFVY